MTISSMVPDWLICWLVGHEPEISLVNVNFMLIKQLTICARCGKRLR